MKLRTALLSLPLGAIIILLTLLPARGAFFYSEADTYTVIDTWGLPGQTVDVPIYFANPQFTVASLLFRVVYDTSKVMAIDVITDSSRLEDLDWFTLPVVEDPGEVRFVGADLTSQNFLQPGAGPIAFILFEISSGFTEGKTEIRFEDNSTEFPPIQNNFSDSAASGNYIPVQIDGHIRVCSATNCPPALNPIPGGNRRNVIVGDTLTFDVAGLDIDDDLITLSAHGLPPNATFPTVGGAGSVAGTFAYPPDSAQADSVYTVVFTIRDDGSPSLADEDTVQIAVYDETIFVRGDVQADKDHDIFDAIFIFNWLGGLEPAPPCEKAADVQDDGDADIFDPIYLLNWLGGTNPAPPPPCCTTPGSCGPDPTPDEMPCESFAPCK